jgi:cation diffusion facilitator family transporter
MKYTELADDPEDAEHSPAERIAAASRSTWVSVGVNVVLTITQIAIGIVAKSQGLIADGIHSLSDLVADFVVLLASHHSKKDADEDHPYGHQRFENAASLVLGTLLLVVGLGMLWSAARKLESPETVQTVHVIALWVAGGALVAKELLFRYMLSVAKRVKSSMLVANAWHARSDAASSLVVGIGIIGNLAGYPILDPIAAAIVGFMVTRMGWSFSWDALHDLMDRAVDEQEVAAIRQHADRDPRRVQCARRAHPQDGRHDRGGRPHRGGCRHQRRGRARHRRRGAPARAAAPPRAEPDDPHRPLAPARPGSRAARRPTVG